MLAVVQSLSAFILVLGILIFVHEFGHFIVAKSFGIGVPVFSLGLGRRLFGFRLGGTEYRISLIPLGGYVRMAGDESDEFRTGAPEEFLSRPRYQRFLVYVAGAALNILLALLLVWLVLWTWGVDEIVPPEDPYLVVSEVLPGSTAEAAGLQVGDRVLAISGRDMGDPNTSPDVLMEEVALAPNQTRPVEIERGGERLTLQLDTGADPRYGLGAPGWALRPVSLDPVKVVQVLDGPAKRAGIRPGDVIVGVDGNRPVSDIELRLALLSNPGKEVRLIVERGGRELDLPVVPEDVDGRGRIQVSLQSQNVVHRSFTAGEAALESVSINLKLSRTLFLVLERLVKREISMRALSGPIEIAQVSREAVSSGLRSLLSLLAFVSLQLGIMNLLPIPILDGGHILILGVEGLMRRDLSTRVKERVMMVGLMFLLVVFASVIYLDVIKAVFSS